MRGTWWRPRCISSVKKILVASSLRNVFLLKTATQVHQRICHVLRLSACGNHHACQSMGTEHQLAAPSVGVRLWASSAGSACQ